MEPALHSWTPDNCSKLSEVAGETLRPGGLALTKYLLELADLPEGSRVLDAGCGLGVTLRFLTEERGLDGVGVDGSHSMLRAAADHAGDRPLVCAALESLPFTEGCFDGVVCECVLSQTSVATVLAEFHRVLRPEGLLLITDLYRRTSCGEPSDRDVYSDSDCLASKERTRYLLSRAGFDVVHWEDRTRDLRQLAAQLIMASGPESSGIFGWSKRPCGDGAAGTGISNRDLGYHLLIARRPA